MSTKQTAVYSCVLQVRRIQTGAPGNKLKINLVIKRGNPSLHIFTIINLCHHDENKKKHKKTYLHTDNAWEHPRGPTKYYAKFQRRHVHLICTAYYAKLYSSYLLLQRGWPWHVPGHVRIHLRLVERTGQNIIG